MKVLGTCQRIEDGLVASTHDRAEVGVKDRIQRRVHVGTHHAVKVNCSAKQVAGLERANEDHWYPAKPRLLISVVYKAAKKCTHLPADREQKERSEKAFGELQSLFSLAERRAFEFRSIFSDPVKEPKDSGVGERDEKCWQDAEQDSDHKQDPFDLSIDHACEDLVICSQLLLVNYRCW